MTQGCKNERKPIKFQTVLHFEKRTPSVNLKASAAKGPILCVKTYVKRSTPWATVQQVSLVQHRILRSPALARQTPLSRSLDSSRGRITTPTMFKLPFNCRNTFIIISLPISQLCHVIKYPTREPMYTPSFFLSPCQLHLQPQLPSSLPHPPFIHPHHIIPPPPQHSHTPLPSSSPLRPSS